MDTKALQEIKAREQAATPGPWEKLSFYICNKNKTVIAGVGVRENAQFIAHARTDIPALVAEVERLMAENSAGKEANKSCLQHIESLKKRADDKDQRIATLEKALSIAAKPKESAIQSNKELCDYYIQHAQEQEGKK